MLKQNALDPTFRKPSVDGPSNRQRNAAEDQQRAEGLEDQSDQPRVHRAIVAGENHAA